ncbi:MAG: hypothetical protein RMJ30_04715 [Nitrososphaerota archaeon]|nr:hypothetical protein [Nitrososphaerota archaeon]
MSRPLRSAVPVALVLALLFSPSTLLSLTAVAERLPPSNEVSVLDAYWGRPGAKVDAGPGDRSMPLTVAVINARRETLISLVGELVLDRSPLRPSGGESGAFAYSSVPVRAGEITYLTFELDVDKRAAPGDYELYVWLGYQYVDARGEFATGRSLERVRVRLIDEPGKPELVDASWSGGLPPEAGAAGRLVVSLRLPEPMAISDVVGELRLPGGLETPAGSRVAKSAVGRLTGTLITLTFDLVSKTSAKSARVELSLSYSFEWGTKRTYVYAFDVQLRGTVRLSFEVLPRELVAGTRNVLKVRVANDGTEEVSQLLLTFAAQPGSPIVVLRPSAVWIDAVKLGEVVEVRDALEVYVSPGASPGAYALTLTAEYYDRTGVKRVRTESVGLVVARPEELVFQVSVASSDLRIGTTGDLRLVLRNVSEEPVGNVVVSLASSPPLAVMGGSDRQRVGSLKPGEAATLAFRIAASPTAQEGVYRVALTISYDDSRGRRLSESREIGLLVKGVVRLRVLNVESIPGLGEGDSVVVAGELLNEGNVGVRNVWVEAAGRDVTGSSSVFMGDVAPGEKKSFSVDLQLRGGFRAGQIAIRVVYEDRFGDREVLEQLVEVKVPMPAAAVQTATTPAPVRSEQPSGQTLLAIAALALSVLISIAVARRLRRRGGG